MLKKELRIKIDYLSIVFDKLKAGELKRKLLGLPLEYFVIKRARSSIRTIQTCISLAQSMFMAIDV